MAKKSTEKTSSMILRNLFEHSKDLIYFKDEAGHFISINKAMAKTHGLENVADVLGKTDFDFYSKEQAESFLEDEQHVLATGEPLIAKQELEVLPNGESVWFSTSKFPLLDDSSTIIGTFGISRDITASMVQLEELKERQNALQEYHRQTEFELEQASRIHRALLPKSLHAPKDLKIDYDYSPAFNLGGDFFSSYDSPYSDSCGLFLCDIMGHGVSAALFTALISSLVETRSKEFLDRPEIMLNGINKDMLSQMPGSYATGTYTYIREEVNGCITLSIANAGHPCPLHYRAQDRSVSKLATHKAPALGIMPVNAYEMDFIQLDPGDKVFYYTDGITEALNSADDEFSRARLLDLISEYGHLPNKALIEKVNTRITNFTENAPQVDDRMMILISTS
jgi:sigma-B regulation protein RsbU (phosphoserine phosphatase)